MRSLATYAAVTALSSVKFMVAVGSAVALQFGFFEQLACTVGGALVGVVVTAYAGDRLRAGFGRLRARWSKHPDAAPREPKPWQRALFSRWGVLGLAIVGPPTLGPVFTVALALGFGATPGRTVAFVSTTVAIWGLVFAAVATRLHGLASGPCPFAVPRS